MTAASGGSETDSRVDIVVTYEVVIQQSQLIAINSYLLYGVLFDPLVILRICFVVLPTNIQGHTSDRVTWLRISILTLPLRDMAIMHRRQGLAIGVPNTWALHQILQPLQLLIPHQESH